MTTTTVPAPRRTVIAGYAAAAWTAAYGTLALTWTVTGDGYPFGPADTRGAGSLLRAVPPDVGAPVFAAVLLAAAVTALAMTGDPGVRRQRLPRALLLTFGWAVAAVLLVGVPDNRLLTLAGYAPMLIVGATFGWPPVDYSVIFTWALANQVISVIAGALMARTVLTWQWRTAGWCVSCGRGAGGTGWTATGAARWGRWATWVAAAVPALYAVVRLAWAAGVPLGISAEFLNDMQQSGLVWAGAGLGAFALVGTVLTMGLVQRWGEVFPRWMLGLAGRRVPVNLAFVPAMVVAVFVTSASLSLLGSPGFLVSIDGWSLATLPMVLWPFWGPALAAAAIAYRLRRRGVCADCGRN